MEQRISMSEKELDRADVIRRVVRHEINGTKAAKLLRLSVRQVRRLKQAFKTLGAKALIHAHRGRPSNHRLNVKERLRIRQLVETRYLDFTPTFASEKLRELHGIDRDPKTIEAIMIDEGVWKNKKARKKEIHRSWRVRRSALGELIQFDGSYHHWLEDRGGTGELCLLAAIDDASGRVLLARFAEHEGVLPVFAFWRDYLCLFGKPRAVYLDKFSTYKMNSAVAAENPDVKTQFQRAMNDLHIEPIFANSPQAKGRVERLFKTLQDRLVKELRLRGIETVANANQFIKEEFIPDFNRRFAVLPASKADLHTKLTVKERTDLPSILSRQETRTIRNDYTIAFKSNWYQILETRGLAIRRGNELVVEEQTDQTLHLRLRGKELEYKALPERPEKAIPANTPWVLTLTKQTKKPAFDHPWRRPFILKQTRHKKRTTRTFLNPAD